MQSWFLLALINAKLKLGSNVCLEVTLNLHCEVTKQNKQKEVFLGQAKLRRQSFLTPAKTLSHNHETAKISDTTQHQVSNRDLNREQYLMLVFVYIHFLCLRELNTGKEKKSLL